ncbi:site-specific integrase [Alcaligenaceae bacterium]|nr:site-specific integrase [Alcaligenaceae bacterium]
MKKVLPLVDPVSNNCQSSDLFKNIATDWLTLIGANVVFTTLGEYERSLGRYFIPQFGSRPIDSITYEELSLYLAKLPVCGKTFNNVMTPLRGVFAYAKRSGKILEDITEHIDWRKHQAPGPDPLEPGEVLRVIDYLRATQHPTWHNYFEVAMFTGIRPSEQIALRWPAVDFRREQLCIRAARVRSREKDTKTHRIRYVDLQSRAAQALIRQRELTHTLTGHIFINPCTGRFFASSATAMDVWREALRETGIRPRSARQTRHTYATLCLHAGMNPAYVSRQMGHTNAKMFFETYSRWLDGHANDREKAKMDAFLLAETNFQTGVFTSYVTA